MRLHWFLPTGGDARDVLPGPDDPHHRPPDLAYLAQIATACDSLGFDGMLTPCGSGDKRLRTKQAGVVESVLRASPGLCRSTPIVAERKAERRRGERRRTTLKHNPGVLSSVGLADYETKRSDHTATGR